MTLSPELAAWRKAERQRLLAARMAASSVNHARWSAAIQATLEEAFPLTPSWTVGFCWPYQAEFDARSFVTSLSARGVRLALPAVVAKGKPLEFLEWRPDSVLIPGVYDIPVPQIRVKVTPDVLLVPPVGIGGAGDRLGYGGGFFDRTLAALTPRPITIAHAFELSRLPTTYPQPHDVLMDFVVTEMGVQAAASGSLELVSVSECRHRFMELARVRSLPRSDDTSL